LTAQRFTWLARPDAFTWTHWGGGECGGRGRRGPRCQPPARCSSTTGSIGTLSRGSWPARPTDLPE